MASDPETYSYDVPSADNFCFRDENDQNVDSWFDTLTDGDNCTPATEDPDCFRFGDSNKAQSGESAASRKSGSAKKPRRSSKRLSAKQRSSKLAQMRAQRVPPKQREDPPSKRQRLTASKSRDSSMVCPPKRKMPTTPTVLKRSHLPLRVKNSEDEELATMQRLQRDLSEKIKKNEASMKSALAGAGQPLKKVPVQVTKPVNVHFHTDDRVKRPQEEGNGDQYQPVDFISALRRHTSPARIPKGGHTIPRPFNLTGAKRKHEETTSDYVSTAEQILAFSRKTPERFHLRSRQKEMEGPSPVKNVKLKLTQPHTPLLQTKLRHRPVACKSSAELEAEELEKLQQYKFKAQELNPKILEGGPINPKKPPVKAPTKPVGFNLEIEKRLQQREKKDDKEEEFTFHSAPCPSKILTDIVGVPEKKLLPITVPQSPAFALKNRVRVQSWEEMKEQPAPIIKANPMPHYGVPFKPKRVEQSQVEMCPFSFTERDRQKMEEKEKKLEQLRNPEVPKFKAQPLPHFDHVALPEKKVKELTHQEPFDLQMERRGAQKLQRWKEQVEEEQKQLKEMSIFKARPNTVTHQEPFMPKKESRILTDPEGFELATERRARERQDFEKRLAELETQRAIIEEEERRQREEQEKEEINRLRHELVHKAQPIRTFKPVEVKTSDLPLTVPKSPKFSDRFNI